MNHLEVDTPLVRVRKLTDARIQLKGYSCRSEDSSVDSVIVRTYIWLPIYRTFLMDNNKTCAGEERSFCRMVRTTSRSSQIYLEIYFAGSTKVRQPLRKPLGSRQTRTRTAAQ